MIRDLREEDGVWMSRYKISLPIEALEQLTRQTGGTVNETLTAYALDDSAYLVGLSYTNDMGQWARINGDWVLLSPEDDTFSDTIVLEINMDMSSEFLDLYDNNFVTVTDAEKYEVADAEVAPTEE